MIELKDINLKFNDKVIFKDFYFFAEKGQKVVLYAPSGHGKTSLFRMMMGFLRPDSGSIIIGKQKLGRTSVDAIRRRICYIGQDVSLPAIKAGEMFAEAAAFSVNRDKDFSHGRILSLLPQFSLTADILEKNLDMVSGGEKRRLAFVLCLLMDREIWLLDEITTGLDEDRKRQMIDCIVASEKTVVVISHDDAWRGCEHVRHVSW